jgi:uncharacterized membrane protein
MSPKKQTKLTNPFYPLLVVVGIVFCITACAYGVMTVRGLRPEDALAGTTESGRQLMEWIDVHGFKLMMIELGLLAVTTVAAIMTDEYWEKKQRESQSTTVDE